MALGDTRQGYGSLSILLHWLGAALVVALFVLGQRIEGLPRGPEMLAARNLHVGVGVAAFLILAARIAWRLANPVAHGAAAPTALDRFAAFVQHAMLAVIALLIVTGPLSIWAGGRAIDVFGLFALPSPLPKIEWLHEATETVHGVGSKLILALVAVHVLGALKHAVIDRDSVVRRMLVPAAE